MGWKIDPTGKLESVGLKISDRKMETIGCLHLAAAVNLALMG